MTSACQLLLAIFMKLASRAQEIVLKMNLDSLAAGAGVGGGGNVVAAVVG